MKKHYLLIIFCFALLFANAQTNVSGGIYTNTTWTKVNSPYNANTVVVFPGVILTIEPGVLVNIIGGIEIRGRLIAEGTPVDSITFIGDGNASVVSIWFNTGDSSRFNYGNFMNGSRMVGRSSNDMSIRHSTFTNNETALWIPGNNCIVDSCSFVNNVHATEQNAAIITNSIFRNNQIGLYTSGGYIQNCLFEYNGIGVDAHGARSITNCLIRNNGIGIYIFNNNGYNTRISSNIIENDSIGIWYNHIFSGTDTIICNRICGNTSYNFRMKRSANVAIANNYWCTTDSGTIASSIYDGYDDPSVGLVNFLPVDISQCYLTPGTCSAFFTLVADTAVLHNYIATNQAYGTGPLTYLWSWGDGTTDTTAYPSHTYANAGFYTICLSIADTTGCTNTYCDSFNLQRNTNTIVTVNVIPQTSTGIPSTATAAPIFSLSPNPATNTVTITTGDDLINSTVTVSDVTGRTVGKFEIVNQKSEINTTGYANGIYFVSITGAGGGNATKKIIISK